MSRELVKAAPQPRYTPTPRRRNGDAVSSQAFQPCHAVGHAARRKRPPTSTGFASPVGESNPSSPEGERPASERQSDPTGRSPLAPPGTEPWPGQINDKSPRSTTGRIAELMLKTQEKRPVWRAACNAWAGGDGPWSLNACERPVVTSFCEPKRRCRALLSCVLCVVLTIVVSTDTRIKTPFQVVPLWSDEMLSYLMGATQPPCSGAKASACERLFTGVCDGTAYFTTGQLTSELASLALPRTLSRQTGSANPQYFALEIQNAGAAMDLALFVSPSEMERLELVLDCSFSGNDACPAMRFQTAAVRRVELAPLNGPSVAAARAARAMPEGPVDLTRTASVRPDGPIVVPIDRKLRQLLFSQPGAIYQVRAVAECFSVAPIVAEWTLPLYQSFSVDAKSAGALIARVNPGDGIEFTYRPPGGEDVKFQPDWVEPDWGYTFMMDQTVLDQKSDWFQLPPRPFPNAVWIHLLGRSNGGVHAGDVYTLSKTVQLRSKGAAGSATFEAGTNVFIVNIQRNALEIRREDPSDGPCTGDDRRVVRRNLPTYVIDAAAFYDQDLHLQLQPAYTRGC